MKIQVMTLDPRMCAGW